MSIGAFVVCYGAVRSWRSMPTRAKKSGRTRPSEETSRPAPLATGPVIVQTPHG
jgi:hypothetical protein